MSQIKESALELIGKTPMMKLNGYTQKAGITNAVILAKLEYLNPAGSVKDRIALAMIEEAEEKGILKEGAVPPDSPVCRQWPVPPPQSRPPHCGPSRSPACSWSF